MISDMATTLFKMGDAMKKIIEKLKSYIFPKTDKAAKLEIDTLNIKNIYYVSLVVGIVQLISIIVFIIANHGFSDVAVNGAVIRVGSSVLLCLLGFICSGMLKNKTDAVKNHPMACKAFIGVFMVLLIAWSIFASVNSYVNHQQILTFYTVELLAVLFVRLHPVFTTSLIVSSYAVNYIILNFGFIKGLINPYNYIMLMVLSAVGAILNYHLTANYISEKNKANLLNKSLEIIANHDSATRLQNRYALNQRIPDFLDKDICVTMGDINKFKEVNDTYGHRTGDDVLKTFADILLQFFPRESVFRYGGDEFLIIENGSDVDTMREKLRKVNEKFAGVRIANMQTGLSFCFGCISAHPQNPTELFSVLTKADQILYDEKEKTKSTFEG